MSLLDERWYHAFQVSRFLQESPVLHMLLPISHFSKNSPVSPFQQQISFKKTQKLSSENYRLQLLTLLQHGMEPRTFIQIYYILQSMCEVMWLHQKLLHGKMPERLFRLFKKSELLGLCPWTHHQEHPTAPNSDGDYTSHRIFKNIRFWAFWIWKVCWYWSI